MEFFCWISECSCFLLWYWQFASVLTQILASQTILPHLRDINLAHWSCHGTSFAITGSTRLWFLQCHETGAYVGDGVVVLLHLGFWVLWRESKRMESCKLAWDFVNQISKCEGFHLANWVCLVCYFVPVTGLFSNNNNNEQKKQTRNYFFSLARKY